PMLDVCVTCLREGVVADEDTLDGAMIFATSFAPFRGGPMHYARSRGAANIRAELERLAQRYGEPFPPRPGWGRLAWCRAAEILARHPGSRRYSVFRLSGLNASGELGPTLPLVGRVAREARRVGVVRLRR